MQRFRAGLNAIAAALLFCQHLAIAAEHRWQGLNNAQPLYVDKEYNDIANALPSLTGQDRNNAALIASFPIATWLTGGTPAQVQAKATDVTGKAAARNQLPVLVAYFLPFRDCQQYSAGGAADTAEYKQWIDGLAAGLGSHKAVIVLEPDGLGIIPHHVTLEAEREWCRPKELDARTAASQRFEQLNYAVDKLARLPNVRVYLDGTHNEWLPAGESAYRLWRAGVLRTAGFFLNVSNYKFTAALIPYGEQVSDCIRRATEFVDDERRLAHFKSCSTVAPAHAHSGLHFIIDTSRNGRGAWTPPADKYADPQAWCNPPARGLGEAPTLKTSHPLLDAKLWIKVPGESDGECLRGTPGPIDPERDMQAPPAGKWFKEQAAELIRFAVPPLTERR